MNPIEVEFHPHARSGGGLGDGTGQTGSSQILNTDHEPAVV